jgi:hypothetical protein
MKLKINTIITASILFSAGLATAEMRNWADKKGNIIEAEHVATLDDKVVLRKADGSEIRVSLDTLSEKDRKYAILQKPPRIEIKVSPKTDRSNTGYNRNVQIQKETVEVEVNIRKSSSAPYEAPLHAELYVIGRPEQHDGYMILDKKVQRIQFTTENDNQQTFSSAPVVLKQLEAGKQAGVEYKGYLVVVLDRKGEIIDSKASKLDYAQNAEAIMAGSKGTKFDGDFNEFGRGKDAPPPRRQKRFTRPGGTF